MGAAAQFRGPVRQSRTGVLLQPDLSVDGDLTRGEPVRG